MIYALMNEEVSPLDRVQIALDIEFNDAARIDLHVKQGKISHILCATNQTYYCIFCLIPVFPTNARPPVGQQAQHEWHFEHRKTGDRPGECIGRIRDPQSYTHGIGIVNPANHGCYILLGCEVDAAGNRTERHRTVCQTISIQAGIANSYCHFANKVGCIP